MRRNLQVRIDVHEAGYPARPGEKLVHADDKGIEVGVPHHEVDGVAETDRRRDLGERHHARDTEQLGPDLTHDRLQAPALPVLRFLQPGEHDPGVHVAEEADHAEMMPHALRILDDPLGLLLVRDRVLEG